MEDDIAALVEALEDAGHAVVLTGAGVSTASGIPSFRGDDGVWGRQFSPRDFELARFESDPAGFWRDRLRLREAMIPEDVAPNPAHEALAALEADGVLDAVVTQNTDGLHRAAGSERVIELHGSGERVVCRDCGAGFDAAPVRDRAANGEVPPRCADCGGVLKPAVVLFGEELPDDAFREARRLARESDAFLAIGSSLVVEPAASLPAEAAQSGQLAIVNRNETPHASRADVVVRGDVTDVLPRVVERLRAE